VWPPVWPPGCSKGNLFTEAAASQCSPSAFTTSLSECTLRDVHSSLLPSLPTCSFRLYYVVSVCLLPVCTSSRRITRCIQPMTSTEEVGWGIMVYKHNCFYRDCYSKPFRRHQELYCTHQEAFDLNAVPGTCRNSRNIVNRLAFYSVLSKILARGLNMLLAQLLTLASAWFAF